MTLRRRSAWPLLIALAVMSMSAAFAAEKPVYGPPGAWVTPFRLRPDRTSPTATAQKILLLDQQVSLSPDADEMFCETVSRIQTPQGLQTAGTINIAWNPEYQTLTIHKLAIIRGAESTDVLASGQTFTVLRRETNLENATLDGTLTAAIQPGGLQVGDTVDLSYTISDSNPVFHGVSEWHLGADAPFPVAHLRLRAQWQDNLPISWRASDSIAGVKESDRGGVHSVAYALDDAQPLAQISQAPARYARLRRIDVTGFASWAAVSQHFAPLFAKAAAISPRSTLNAEIAHIRRSFTDPAERAAAALALVQDQVRYVFLGADLGGYVPAAADLTWARRFGDCKGKTVLLVAILRGLGITADPAFVSTREGDGLDEKLPIVSYFDHALVRARIGGDIFWLDGTRSGDRDLDKIAVPPFHWGLPLTENGSGLEPIKPIPLRVPAESRSLRIDASAGLDAPATVHAEMAWRGDFASALRIRLSNASPQEAEQWPKQIWARLFNTVDVKSATSSYSEQDGVERITMDGSVPRARSFLTTDALVVGNERVLDFDRTSGPGQDAPFAVPFPFYVEKSETIMLPNHGAGWTLLAGDVDCVIAGIAYKRTSQIQGGIFTGQASARALVPEFPAAEAPTATKALRDLVQKTVIIHQQPRSGAQ